MTLRCHLRLEFQGHRFELRSRQDSGSQLEVDFFIPSVLAMLALSNAVGRRPPTMPPWLRVQVWLRDTRLVTL